MKSAHKKDFIPNLKNKFQGCSLRSYIVVMPLRRRSILHAKLYISRGNSDKMLSLSQISFMKSVFILRIQNPRKNSCRRRDGCLIQNETIFAYNAKLFIQINDVNKSI